MALPYFSFGSSAILNVKLTFFLLCFSYLDVKLTLHDPLEDFLTQLMNDGVESALQLVVKETLQDLTEDALIFSGSCDVIDDFICAEIEQAVPELVRMLDIFWKFFHA